ncbi:DUF2336 domain-containing protein [Stappia sp. F7233]|uniref:DUF2336 domain-containing protein n=1 Tax=Stappia albiluteola TaxID=2758565 RepID=A0A839AF91_9HYPH|nr:DUF2336 domain-containing protein [Stappia albiluteola]MBA5777229.1 DUF2336 domain-containing protein [Stappia albiluteola]
MLNELVRLARDATPASRGKLLQRVADVFLDGIGGHSQAELELFCDVILRLLDTTSVADRAALSRRIAPVAGTPQPIAIRLAKDDITVAAPMLEMSPALSEADLMKLARRMPQTHLEAIARRANMNPRLCDTLIERGKTRVWREIAANTSIRMSDWGLRTLAKHALKDVPLREHMANRRDLTPLICEWLLPHVNPTTRLRLQAIMSGSDPMETSDVNRIRQDLRRRLGVYLDNCDATRLWGLVENGDSSLNDLLVLLFDEKRINDAVALLAKATDRPATDIQTAMFKAPIDELIELALAAGVTDHTFLAIAQLRCRQLRMPDSQAVRWLELYRSMRAGARIGIRPDTRAGRPLN